MIYNWIFAVLVIAFGIWYFTSFNNKSKKKGKSEKESLRKREDRLPAKKEMYEEAEEKI